MLRSSRLCWCLWGMCAAWASPGRDVDTKEVKAVLAGLPLRFEANQGQWQPEVRYAARAGGYTVALTQAGASLCLPNAGRVDLSLTRSNAAAVMEPLDRTAMRTDYYRGPRQNWHTGIASYGRVRYRGVYPGVDVVYYGNQSQLEYDFMLAPGADADAIRLRFGGAERVRVTPEGDLVVEAGGGQVLQKKPRVYQDGRAIAGRYALLAGDEVGLRLGSYNHRRGLTIDPLLLYSTYLGGNGDEQITALRMDQKGNLYVAGSTSSNNLLFVNGAYDIFNDGGVDVFVAIIDTTPAGGYNTTYLSYLGGSGNDFANAMAIDSAGNIYLTGITDSTDFPLAGNSVVTTGVGAAGTAFVAELNPSMYGGVSLLYSTYLGGATNSSAGNGIDVDAYGNIYVIGTTQAGDFPVTPSAYAGVIYGIQDAFLCELSPYTTAPIYSTFLGGELDDDGRAIAVSPQGLVYFGISTESTQFPLQGNSYHAGPIPTTGVGTYDVILGVMDMTQFGEASLIYDTYFGGSDNDEVRAIALDAKGNLLVTGYTLSTDFPVTPDAAQGTAGGNGDAFVSKVNPNNSNFVLYSSYLGGSEGEVAYAVTGDSKGNIYVTGYTLSGDFPVQNAPQPQWGNGIDVFVTELTPGVNGMAGLQYSTYFGQDTVNQGSAVVLGPDGSLYVAGGTSGAFPTTSSAAQIGFNGGATDGFVLVLSQQ